MQTPPNDYHQVQCPHCKKHVVIRLEPAETWQGQCLCKAKRIAVSWTDGKPALIQPGEAHG